MDLGVLVHDSMVNIWKTTNEWIEDRLEVLQVDKEALKSSNKELVEYIKYSLGSTSSSQFDPNAEENKNLLLKLQQERQFRKIGRTWIEAMKVQGPIVINNLGNLLLDADKLKDTTSKH